MERKERKEKKGKEKKARPEKREKKKEVTVFDHVETMKGLARLIITRSLNDASREEAKVQLGKVVEEVVNKAKPAELTRIHMDLLRDRRSSHNTEKEIAVFVRRDLFNANVRKTMEKAKAQLLQSRVR